jgi:type IV pilus assembly protein PilM
MARKETAVGLDIGLTTTKMVVVEKRRGDIQVVDARVLHQRQEGILSDDELHEALPDWLAESNRGNAHFVVNIPQYLADAQLNDFPANASRDQLRDMVAYQTQQVAGLSNEAIVHDFQQMQPCHRYKNPVLVAQCRESVLENRLAPLTDSELMVRDLTIEGVALANACLQQHPVEVAEPGFQLVLNMGADNTTAVIIEEGQTLYAGSIPVGGDAFTQTLYRELGVSENEAEQAKKGSRLIMSDTASPLASVARDFVDELNSALDSWFYELTESSTPLRFSRIFLCGGGGRLSGFGEFLGGRYSCDIVNLHIRGTRADEDGDLLAIAYGLALHGFLQPPPCDVALAPEWVSWLDLRRRRQPFYGLAVAVAAAIVFGLMAVQFVTLGIERNRLRKEQALLQQCEVRIPQLTAYEQKIKHLKSMLTPISARGNRNWRFVQAVSTMSRYQHDDMWLVYLADETSYFKPEVASGSAPLAGRAARPFVGSMENAADGPADDLAFSHDVEPWQTLYAAGFTPQLDANSLVHVKDAISQLNADSMFTNVDILSAGAQAEHMVRAMGPWLKEYQMKPFALGLPLRKPDDGDRDGGSR